MNFKDKLVPVWNNREIVSVFVLTVILLSAVWMFSLPTSHASQTLTVPQDYPTIAQAISHASSGDTVEVKQGVYHENVQINKSLTLIGEGKENTLIIGEGGPNQPAVLTLAASDIKVSGFTDPKRQQLKTYAKCIWHKHSRRQLHNQR